MVNYGNRLLNNTSSGDFVTVVKEEEAASQPKQETILEKAKETIAVVATKASDVISDATAKASDVLSDATAKASDVLSGATAKAGDVLSSATAKTSDVISDATARVGGAIETIKQQAELAAAQVPIKSETTEAERATAGAPSEGTTAQPALQSSTRAVKLGKDFFRLRWTRY